MLLKEYSFDIHFNRSYLASSINKKFFNISIVLENKSNDNGSNYTQRIQKNT